MTRLRIGLPGLDSRQGQGFFSLRHRVHTCSGTHPTSCSVGTVGSLSESKAAGACSWPHTSIHCRS